MIKFPGRVPSVLEARMIKELFFKNIQQYETIVIHHVTEDSAKRLQVEYEIRTDHELKTRCTFHRKVFAF